MHRYALKNKFSKIEENYERLLLVSLLKYWFIYVFINIQNTGAKQHSNKMAIEAKISEWYPQTYPQAKADNLINDA